MFYPHNKKVADRFKKQVLQKLDAYSLPATPNNYELWYVYYSGEHPDVVRAIDFLLQSHDTLSQENCLEIYDRFLSDNRTDEHFQQAGQDLQNTINNVSTAVEEVSFAASSYNETLEDINTRLSGDPSEDELKNMVVTARSNTEQVMNYNRNLEEALEQSTSEIVRLRGDLEQFRKEALTDGLTGLANRKAFDDELRRIHIEARDNETSFTLLMLDIDHFKNFNDNFGHQVGDQVLRLVARCLIDGVKGKDVAARYGGEEFVIILPETELASGVAVGNSLRKSVANKDVINRNTGDRLGRITMSVGVAEFSGAESREDLISRSDAALYTAKHNGRNQVAAAPTPTK